MHKKLMEFLPDSFSEIKEFQLITSIEDTEFEIIDKEHERILYENFIDTATEIGIKHLENLYKIRNEPNLESLEFRKLRLKNRKMNKMNITYRALEQKLKILFGEGNYKLSLDNDKYLLKVEVNTFDWNAFYEITDNFRYIIPCNMVLKSTICQSRHSKVYVGAVMRTGEEITIYPWFTKNLESKGKVNIGIANNAGLENISIYPKEG